MATDILAFFLHMKKKFPEIGLKDEWPWDSYAVLNPVVE
jgi:hypothetical protein